MILKVVFHKYKTKSDVQITKEIKEIIMKKFFAIILSLVLVFSFTCATPVKAADVTAEDIAKQIMTYFAKEPANVDGVNTAVLDSQMGVTDADIERKLQELEKLDANLAKQMRRLVEDWTKFDTAGYVNFYHPKDDYTINESEMITGIPNDKTVVIFVYGNQMRTDEGHKGEMSDEHIGRAKTTLALALKYPNVYIAVSGGHTANRGAAATETNLYDSEAGAMYKWLTQTPLQPSNINGEPIEGMDPVLEDYYIDPNRPTIDPSRIIIDEVAMDTVGNITNTMNKLPSTVNKFVTVTSSYHIPRATLFLDSYIIKNNKNYEIIDNLGWAQDGHADESLSMQLSGVCSFFGFTKTVSFGSFSFEQPDVPAHCQVSDPATLNVSLKSGVQVKKGDDLRELLKATATYTNTAQDQNTDGFEFDVVDQIEISGYDPNKAGEQSVTFSYKYNGKTIYADLGIVVKDNVNPDTGVESIVGLMSLTAMASACAVVFVRRKH